MRHIDSYVKDLATAIETQEKRLESLESDKRIAKKILKKLRAQYDTADYCACITKENKI